MVEIKRYFRDICILHVALNLAGSIAAGDEDVVAHFHMTLAHQSLNAIVAAVYEDTVGNSHIALHIHMKAVFVSVGIAYSRHRDRRARLDETSCQNPFIRRTGHVFVHILYEIEVVLSHIEYESVDNHGSHRAGISDRPPCIDVEQRSDELLVGRLDLGDVLDYVTLVEIR